LGFGEDKKYTGTVDQVKENYCGRTRPYNRYLKAIKSLDVSQPISRERGGKVFRKRKHSIIQEVTEGGVSRTNNTKRRVKTRIHGRKIETYGIKSHRSEAAKLIS